MARSIWVVRMEFVEKPALAIKDEKKLKDAIPRLSQTRSEKKTKKLVRQKGLNKMRNLFYPRFGGRFYRQRIEEWTKSTTGSVKEPAK